LLRKQLVSAGNTGALMAIAMCLKPWMASTDRRSPPNFPTRQAVQRRFWILVQNVDEDPPADSLSGSPSSQPSQVKGSPTVGLLNIVVKKSSKAAKS
jgi:fatty acid/phospholipid biosynthesis enzyme